MSMIEWLENGYGGGSADEQLGRLGGLARAAWELARAQCVQAGYVTPVPTAVEVGAAYKRLAWHFGVEASPQRARLAVEECHAEGLPML